LRKTVKLKKAACLPIHVPMCQKHLGCIYASQQLYLCTLGGCVAWGPLVLHAERLLA